MAALTSPRTTSGSKRRRLAPGFGDIASGPRRVAVYLRRSTDDEHQPFSITAQDTALTRYVTTCPALLRMSLWGLVSVTDGVVVI